MSNIDSGEFSGMSVIALLNQKGGVGKTTLSINIATAMAMSGSKVMLVDADPQGSALDWAAQRQSDLLFPVVGVPKPTLHREIPNLRKGFETIIIDGAPRVNELARSAIIASDLVLIPVQPSPFDVWAAQDIIDIINEAIITKPEIKSGFVINRRFPNTTLGAEVQEALKAFNLPVLKSTVCNRTDFAKAAKDGLTTLETDPDGPAASEIRALVKEIRSLL
jgi:chromosome partitioning protein